MSFRRLSTIGLLAIAATLVPALPGSAATPTATNCPSGSSPTSPTNTPTLSIVDSPSTIYAGNFSSVFGKFSINGCAIQNATIKIQRRLVVSGSPTGSWSTVKTVVTSSRGVYAAAYFVNRNVQLRGVFYSAGGFPHTNSSTSPRLNVRTSIGETVRKLAACKVTFSGNTTPVKASRTVTVQNRVSNKWVKVTTAKTNSTGHYAVTRTLTCGRSYHVSAYISGDSINFAGRSALVSVTPSH